MPVKNKEITCMPMADRTGNSELKMHYRKYKRH